METPPPDFPLYEVIDHTADLQIRVFGQSYADLFNAAADALTDLLLEPVLEPVLEPGTNPGPEVTGTEVDLEIRGFDPPDLMVNWLRELLFRFTAKEEAAAAVRIRSASAECLRAGVGFVPLNTGIHRPRYEIKAVTYHDIRVEETAAGWEAKILFDV